MAKAPLARLAAALALIPLASPAWAWSEETHQTTGAIAWADLARRNPAALAELLAIARNHQDYPLFAARAAALPEPVRQRALFEWLARWPDDIRGGPEDQPKWHYALRVVAGRSWLWPLRNGTAKEGFAFNYAQLASPCAPPADRARAIGWLIHIVGDIQQPLHAGHQMSADFPATDRAGELAFVRRFADNPPVNLHQYWDKIFQQSRVSAPGGDWAAALMAAWPRQKITGLDRSGSAVRVFASQVEETRELARMVGYRGTFLAAVPAGQAAPVVTAAENAYALALSGRRVATGGYRIADTLAMAVSQSKTTPASCTARP
jgi:hypothetical protein